jgi:hypothetical protein
MNAKHIIATAAIAFAGSAFAAEAPVANASATAAAAVAATNAAAASLNLPTVQVSAGIQRSRAEVHAEAVEAVKNYKSTLATQLEHARN